jgi:DNA-directed RNA polymerase subunit RPC12/RpoP
MQDSDKDPNHYEGIVRTDMYCTECRKNFIAKLDFSIEGNHEIICPHCGHEHCRVIKNGKITEDRWSSKQHNTVVAETQRIWTHTVLKATTSSAAEFLRERWLNKEGA